MKHLKTFEEFSINPEIEKVEEGLFDGVKTLNLTTLNVSKEAQDFITKRKDLKATYTKALTKMGMDVADIDIAIMAIYDFGKGTPMLNKYELTYDDNAKTLKINPNGKGLFNGHPIMG